MDGNKRIIISRCFVVDSGFFFPDSLLSLNSTFFVCCCVAVQVNRTIPKKLELVGLSWHLRKPNL